MLNERYLHPNGQVPAYEWNFSDVNPPVHAWATLRVYAIEKAARGQGDIAFLQDAFRSSCSISTGGSTAKIPKATISSAADSWGSITSASSTAARRCPLAVIWSSRTGGLDGLLRLVHAADCTRACHRRSGLSIHGAAVF